MINVLQATEMTNFNASPSLAFPSNCTAGSVIVVMFYLATATPPTVTDTLGNTYVQVGTSQPSNGGASHSFTFICLGCKSSGANTVTVNSSGFDGAIGLLLEANGFGVPTPENWTGTASTDASDTTATITPSTTTSLVCAMAQPGGNTGCTISSPFIGGSSATGSFCQGGYLVLSADTPTDAEFTGMGSANGLIIFDVANSPVNNKPNVCIMT